MFIGAGGYYALGVGGKQNYYDVNGYRQTLKISFGKESELTRSGWRLVFEFGAYFRENYVGHFFYDMGLMNILPDATTTNYNRVVGFKLAWYF